MSDDKLDRDQPVVVETLSETKQLVTPCILTMTFDQHGSVSVSEWHVSGVSEGYTRTHRFESVREFTDWIIGFSGE